VNVNNSRKEEKVNIPDKKKRAMGLK